MKARAGDSKFRPTFVEVKQNAAGLPLAKSCSACTCKIKLYIKEGKVKVPVKDRVGCSKFGWAIQKPLADLQAVCSLTDKPEPLPEYPVDCELPVEATA